MPKRKDNPRNDSILVAVTKEEKEALRAKASADDTSISSVAYTMLLKGNLEALTKAHRAKRS